MKRPPDPRPRPAGPALIVLVTLCAGLVAGAWLPRPSGAGAPPGREQEVQLGLEFDRAHRINLLLEELAPLSGATPTDAKNVGDVVLNDLNLSDLFNVAPAPAGLALAAAPDTAGWFRQKGDGSVLVKSEKGAWPNAKMVAGGQLSVAGSELVLDAYLKEYPSLRTVLTRTYRTKPEWFREIAHRFSDDIVLYLTGEEGIARTRIAFINNGTGAKELYITDYDGTNVRQITRDKSITVSPAWLGDGQRIAFTSFRRGDPDLYQVNLGNGEISVLSARAGPDMAPASSRDGQRMAFAAIVGGNTEIFVADGQGRGAQQVTHNSGIDTAPAWSPTGRELCFTSDRSGDPQVYICDAEGGNVRRLTYDGRKNDSPDWSPDGRRIVYVSLQDPGFKIWSIGVDGSDNRPLTFGNGSDENPKWAPDGRKIVFTSTREGKRQLYTMNADGSGIRRLTFLNGECGGTSWSRRAPR